VNTADSVVFDAAMMTPLASNVNDGIDVVLPIVVEVTLFATCMRAGTTRVIAIVVYLLDISLCF
jgi:hypothetical protein